ncbi:uncharacterized protein LOC133779739 [Humulus lupulus]|uniref:uncharacterized protein LOC133779739 n=1 Tax=Humulus lupulus TaxID=3486 RepID=UPI002B412338|nr:uncharacterized protein LOC133779739 [Humulus lupulus]
MEDIRSIRQRLHTTIDRQRKFEVGDKVLLKIAPLRGPMRFEKKGKLCPRYIGPFEVLECIRKVAYKIALPPAFSRVHDVFHVSTLRKYMNDPTHVLSYDELSIDPQLSYEQKPGRDFGSKRQGVKEQDNTFGKGAVETEAEKRERYPNLF